MKKFITILVLLNINLICYSQNSYTGRYVNENISIPIFRIGTPTNRDLLPNIEENSIEYISPQTIEKNLAIPWNKWHANVCNNISKDIQNGATPNNYIVMAMFDVDRNQKLSNIIITYFPETSLNMTNLTATIKKDQEFYVYNKNRNKHYKATLPYENYTIGANGTTEEAEMTKILTNSIFKEYKNLKIYQQNIPCYQILEQMANRIYNRQGQQYLIFPAGSKRDSVKVAGGVTDIITIFSVLQYTADMFQDLESY